MLILRDLSSLRQALAPLRCQGKKIGFVPTMGALHQGHLSLVHKARRGSDVVVASIFVNPKQFGPMEDFATYPRHEDHDLALLKDFADVVYLPTIEDMYDTNLQTTISVTKLKQGLCGASRPSFFDGVALVVTKLLNRVMPDHAWFGEKDYQQCLVIKQLVHDLDIPTIIHTVPTFREDDGLAMSSRNVYLNSTERAIAPHLYSILFETKHKLEASPTAVTGLLSQAKHALVDHGFTSVEYLELRDASTLEALKIVDRKARLLAAVRLGATRLIDNIPVLEKIV